MKDVSKNGILATGSRCVQSVSKRYSFVNCEVSRLGVYCGRCFAGILNPSASRGDLLEIATGVP
jgi:hypothetical protein